MDLPVTFEGLGVQKKKIMGALQNVTKLIQATLCYLNLNMAQTQ